MTNGAKKKTLPPNSIILDVRFESQAGIISSKTEYITYNIMKATYYNGGDSILTCETFKK